MKQNSRCRSDIEKYASFWVHFVQSVEDPLEIFRAAPELLLISRILDLSVE
jgi:hypothetical protein